MKCVNIEFGYSTVNKLQAIPNGANLTVLLIFRTE